jgi:hypothetical protein
VTAAISLVAVGAVLPSTLLLLLNRGLDDSGVATGAWVLTAVVEGLVLPEPLLDCQPRFRESSYHQLRSIQPSNSVISVEEPASMMKLVTPVGVQSGVLSVQLKSRSVLE